MKKQKENFLLEQTCSIDAEQTWRNTEIKQTLNEVQMSTSTHAFFTFANLRDGAPFKGSHMGICAAGNIFRNK